MKNIFLFSFILLCGVACQSPTAKPEANVSKASKTDAPVVQVTPTSCYQFNQDGEHVSCQIANAADGAFTGYHSWFIDGKDGAYGVLSGKNSGDSLIADHTYMQEGSVASEEVIFLKKGDNLVELVGERVDKGGKMVIKDRTKLKTDKTLTKVDCAKIEKDFDNIKAMEKDKVFRYPDPVLSEKEEKIARILEGDWQSKDDPKAGILIGKGQFTFLYDGKDAEPPARYIYYPTCPKDCNPMAKMPCLKIIGQDDVCYSILKIDAKSLDISQIGGKGNTNRYVRKR